MTHDELASRLAQHLRGRQDPPMVWTDMQLGPVGSPRPDVYVIDKSYSAFRPLAYEVKVSVSDFRADVTKGKWQTYRPMASGIWFAFPDTLKIGRDDVPAECGILRYNEAADKWSTLRRPVLRPIESLPQKVWLKLLIDGVERERGPEWRRRQFNEWRATEELRKKFGDRAADVLRDIGAAEARAKLISEGNDREIVAERVRCKAVVEQAEARVKDGIARERGNLTQRERELAQALGLGHCYTLEDLAQRLGDLARLARVSNAYGAMESAVSAMKRQLGDVERARDAMAILIKSVSDPDGMPAGQPGQEVAHG